MKFPIFQFVIAPWEQPGSTFFLPAIGYLHTLIRSHLRLLQAQQSQLSDPDFMTDTPSHLCGPLLDSLPLDPFLQPVKVPLDSGMTLLYIGCSSQFCVIYKLSAGTHSVLSSVSVMKMFNSIRLSADPWGTLVVPGL